MPHFFRATGQELNHRFSQRETAQATRDEGFTSSGAIVLRKRRCTLKAEIPYINKKSRDFSRLFKLGLPP
jgi:hypothetical protein